jgi:DNA polymerase III epsilon subunit-like protein/8-oxo-dGTP pyrophosphatase MutT (NUDIX family)
MPEDDGDTLSAERNSLSGMSEVRPSHWDTRLAVFDLETTGVDTDTSRIVSACIAVLEPDGALHAQFNWLADPEIEIPEGASAVHGITTERAREDGRTAETVVGEITATIRALLAVGIPLVVYNAPYDLSLLDRECRRHRVEPLGYPTPVIDPLVIDKAVDRYRKGKRTLVAAAERYGVNLDDAHDAAADAIAAGRVAQAIARTFPDDVDVPFPDLHGRQQIWYAEQAASFQQYIREVKGDENYVAESSWPLRPLDDPMMFEDTVPLPIPRPRPSATIPTFDFDQPLALEAGPPPASSRPRSKYADAPPPLIVVEHTVIEESVTVEVFDEPVDGPLDLRPAEPEPAAGGDGLSDEGVSDDPSIATVTAFVEPLAPLVPRAPKPTVLRIAAAVVTDPGGRSLLVRKRGSAVFMQPGGKIESGESALTALTRELREELGLVVDPAETEYIGSYRAIAANEENTVVRAEVFFLVTHETPVAGAEIEELLWVERLDDIEVEVAPLSRDSLLPLWAERSSTLF